MPLAPIIAGGIAGGLLLNEINADPEGNTALTTPGRAHFVPIDDRAGDSDPPRADCNSRITGASDRPS